MRAVEFFESTGREIKKWFANQGVKVKVRNIRGKYISVAPVEGDMPNEFRKMVIDKVPFFQSANITDMDNIDYGNVRSRYIAISPDQWDMVMAPEASRQLGDPSREVMVVKDGKVIVIDAEDEAEYLENGWTLAESVLGKPVNEAWRPRPASAGGSNPMDWAPASRIGRPRGASHIENVRFWDLPNNQLKFIIKDAGEAMKANPTGRKAISGPGNYADQVNDATTVLYWRKMHGIDKAKPEYPEYEVKYAKSKSSPIMVTKFMTFDQAKEFLADVEKDGMKGIISKHGKPVKEEIELDDVSTKKMNTAKSQFRRGMSETPTEEYVQSGTFGTFKTAPVTIEIVKKGKGRLDAILKGAGKKQRLATYVQKHTPEELIARLEKTYGGKFNQSGGVNWNAGVETYHGEGWKVGDVYHQEFENGDRVYFRADSVQKNKRWKGLSVDEFGGRQKKAKNSTADENLSSWEITPKNEIPKALKEEVSLDEAVRLPSSIDDVKMTTLVVNLGAAIVKKVEKLPGTAPIVTQMLDGMADVRKSLESKMNLVGKEAVVEFLKAAQKHFTGSMPPISTMVKKYKLPYDRFGDKVEINKIKSVRREEDDLDEATPSVVKKAGRRAAGSWGRPGSKKQKRAASKSSRQWNLKDLDHGDEGGGSELGPEGPYAIVWHGQYLEWYGDSAPSEGEGRYKSKGDAGNVLAKNIPTYAIAQKLLPTTEKMSDVGDYGDYGEDGSLVTNSSAPEIVPMSELGKHFYGYESTSQEYGATPEQDDHHKVMDLKTKMIDISQPEIGYVESIGNAWESYKNTSQKKRVNEITDIEMGKSVTQYDLDYEEPAYKYEERPKIVGKLKNGMRVAVDDSFFGKSLRQMTVVLYGKQKKSLPVGTISLTKSGNGWISSYSKITTKYQGRGLGVELYKFIIKTLGILLISDMSQTPGSQKVWVKLAQTPGIYVYGRRTSAGRKTQFFHVEPDALNQLSGELEVYDAGVEDLLDLDLKDYWKLINDMIAKGEISPTKGQQMHDKERVRTNKEIRELSNARNDTVLIATATKPPARGFIDLKALKNEGKLSEKAPPGREDQVKELKGKVNNPYAVAWASYNKSN